MSSVVFDSSGSADSASFDSSGSADLDSTLIDLLEDRKKLLLKSVQMVWKEMGIESDVPFHLEITSDRFSLNSTMSLIPKKGFCLHLPALFFIDLRDFQENNTYAQLFSRIMQSHVLSKDEERVMNVFFEFIKDPKLASRAKTFILYHELAHVLHGDLLSDADSSERRAREKRADLTAAKLSGCADGYIYFLKIKSELRPVIHHDHPSYQERIEYLSPFKHPFPSQESR